MHQRRKAHITAVSCEIKRTDCSIRLIIDILDVKYSKGSGQLLRSLTILSIHHIEISLYREPGDVHMGAQLQLSQSAKHEQEQKNERKKGRSLMWHRGGRPFCNRCFISQNVSQAHRQTPMTGQSDNRLYRRQGNDFRSRPRWNFRQVQSGMDWLGKSLNTKSWVPCLEVFILTQSSPAMQLGFGGPYGRTQTCSHDFFTWWHWTCRGTGVWRCDDRILNKWNYSRKRITSSTWALEYRQIFYDQLSAF